MVEYSLNNVCVITTTLKFNWSVPNMVNVSISVQETARSNPPAGRNELKRHPVFTTPVLNTILTSKKYSIKSSNILCKLADYVKYDNVGTWEWIISRSGQPYLLEVNTRIQVENDISARISYIGGEQPNLIREQIRLGLGNRMGYKQSAVKFKGAAIELRIVAEDTRRGFAPWIGTITEFKFPGSPMV